MPNVQLKVGTKIYRGWTAMRVQRSIEQAAGAFALQLTERWPGQPQRWIIEPGEACTLLLDNQVVITGYIDSEEKELGANTHSIKVVGRDKVGDIVDCSALKPNDKTGGILGQTLQQVANNLCKPYGISVTNLTEENLTLPSWGIQETESVWENIERGARHKAVLIISDGKGGLDITRAGHTINKNSLVEGVNVLSAKLARDNSQRYSRYIIRTQTPGLDGVSPTLAAHGKATISDDIILRERPYLFEPEDLADGVTLKDRVRWERNIRRGKSRRVIVTVQGWSVNGYLWQPNEMVNVSLPTLGIGGDLLIVSVNHTLDDQGSRTELVLSPREAYDLLPERLEQEGGMVSGVSQETMELLQ